MIEDEGYVGDAQMTGLPPGESRMVSFATDKKVEITTESKPEESVSQIKIIDGTVHAVRISRLNTTYMVKGAADADRIVIIEHPRMAGWEVTSEALQGSTPTHHRLRAKVGAGKTVTIAVKAEQRNSELFALMDADTLVAWSGASQDPKPPSS